MPDWVNYHHLFYFWMVVTEGSVVGAARKLRLAQPTVSAQLRALQEALQTKLFERSGKKLVLTESGSMVFEYAEEIFALGREMLGVLEGRPSGKPLQLRVGISDVVPKLISCRLLQPVLHMPEPVQIFCREDKPERLLRELVFHELDMILTDDVLDPPPQVKVFHHVLGESAVSFFASPKLIRTRRKFPQNLEGAPFLMPFPHTALRRSLDRWFAVENIRVKSLGEFQDSALIKAFGEAGEGIFAAPSVIEQEIERQYEVKKLGRTHAVKEKFYALSVERKLKHPAVMALAEAAKRRLFR